MSDDLRQKIESAIGEPKNLGEMENADAVGMHPARVSGGRESRKQRKQEDQPNCTRGVHGEILSMVNRSPTEN